MHSLSEALAAAQARANSTGRDLEVWEHVGDYGNPTGDIPARHTFTIQLTQVDKPNDWAMIAIVRPETAKETK